MYVYSHHRIQTRSVFLRTTLLVASLTLALAACDPAREGADPAKVQSRLQANLPGLIDEAIEASSFLDSNIVVAEGQCLLASELEPGEREILGFLSAGPCPNRPGDLPLPPARCAECASGPFSFGTEVARVPHG